MDVAEIIKINWEAFTSRQKKVFVALVLLILVVISSGWLNAFSSWRQLRGLKSEVSRQKQISVDALAKAIKISKERDKLKQQVEKLESKRDEKENEVKESKTEVDDARDDYDRAVREPRTDNPSTSQLCKELKELGYPCTDSGT